MVKKKEKPIERLAIMACCDYQRRTCIQLTRSETEVRFVPLDVRHGLKAIVTSTTTFDQRYKPMVGYPPIKACELFLRYSQDIGATKEVIGYLKRVIEVSDAEAEKAINKEAYREESNMRKSTKAAPIETVVAAKKSKKVALPASMTLPLTETLSATPVTKPKLAPTKTVVKPQLAPTKAPTKAKGKRHSAAQMFKDLIMDSDLTDDQIFATVQAEFNLDDSKRHYVAWYRAWLRSHGFNPPAPM